jgi:hypothetical protein
VGAVCVLTAIASAQATFPASDVLFVNYFTNAHSATPTNPNGLGKDGKVRILNPGTFEAGTGLLPRPGNLCALIYVFDQNQQLLECCGCQVTPNGVRELSVNDDLTDNSLTGGQIYAGGIKIVSHPPNGPPPKFYNRGEDSRCNPASIANPRPTLRAWITHPQTGAAQVVYEDLTEEEFLEAALSASEVRRLQGRCRFIITNASGYGICSCGYGGEDN